jgi:hypothetical protein
MSTDTKHEFSCFVVSEWRSEWHEWRNPHGLDMLGAILDCAERCVGRKHTFRSNFEREVWQACIQFGGWNAIYAETMVVS